MHSVHFEPKSTRPGSRGGAGQPMPCRWPIQKGTKARGVGVHRKGLRESTDRRKPVGNSGRNRRRVARAAQRVGLQACETARNGVACAGKARTLASSCDARDTERKEARRVSSARPDEDRRERTAPRHRQARRRTTRSRLGGGTQETAKEKKAGEENTASRGTLRRGGFGSASLSRRATHRTGWLARKLEYAHSERKTERTGTSTATGVNKSASAGTPKRRPK
ncbi:hypothetical protein TRVL_06588 [Trypanosoma vivax]|nr:hypothetical protein TRVL_06588 [Trypanosoma vivax]